MTLLIPLGLLGLISIIAFIVIYIVKPNYQHKDVSSTYVWKLSLKYRKKRLPTSKLRNILLIVCQVLALVAGALIMAQPIIRDDKGVFDSEVVAIIDASASMRAGSEEDGKFVTRFERAVGEVTELANDTIDKGGYVSVILSDGSNGYLVQRAGLSAKADLNKKLNALIEDKDDLACSYGANKLDNAITLCEDVVRSNPSASVYLYTDASYENVPKGMNLVNVAKDDEWNVGILNAYSEFEEGYYTFTVEVGCYGPYAKTVNLNVYINDANEIDKDGRGEYVEYSAEVDLRDNAVTTVIFRNSAIPISDAEKDAQNLVVVSIGADSFGLGDKNKTCVFAYDTVLVEIDEEDSLSDDNSFSIYGGRKQPLRVQYATTKPRTFFTGMFGVLRDFFDRAGTWELEVKELTVPREAESLASKDFDLYVYEGYTPTQLPKDGVVFLWNPDTMPAGLTKRDTRTYVDEMYLAEIGSHPILAGTDATKIFARRLTQLAQYDAEIYTPLWSADDNPVLLINDGDNEKVIVSLFDLEWSNFGLRKDFPYLIYNIFKTFMPATVIGHVFEVGQEIEVNARGSSLTVSRNSGSDERTITDFPSKITLDKPDTYEFLQQSYFGKNLSDVIFVKIPSAESNIAAVGLSLKTLYLEDVSKNNYNDLLVYLAAAMLALLFTEWFLQTQESL